MSEIRMNKGYDNEKTSEIRMNKGYDKSNISEIRMNKGDSSDLVGVVNKESKLGSKLGQLLSSSVDVEG